MYAPLIGMESTTNGHAHRTFDANIQDYARWEYGRNDVAWLYARAAAGRTPKRGLWRRLEAFLRRDLPMPKAPSPESPLR